MNEREQLEVLKSLRYAMIMLEGVDLEGVLAAANRADSVGAVIDPTLYRDGMDALGAMRSALEAARSFRAACAVWDREQRKVRPEIRARAAERVAGMEQQS